MKNLLFKFLLSMFSSVVLPMLQGLVFIFARKISPVWPIVNDLACQKFLSFISLIYWYEYVIGVGALKTASVRLK